MFSKKEEKVPQINVNDIREGVQGKKEEPVSSQDETTLHEDSEEHLDLPPLPEMEESHNDFSLPEGDEPNTQHADPFSLENDLPEPQELAPVEMESPEQQQEASTIESQPEAVNQMQQHEISSTPAPDTMFITTEQYEQMQDIFNYVQAQVSDVKSSYEQVMALKNEQDVEIENLKKDFEKIEEQLYKLDEVLFKKNG